MKRKIIVSFFLCLAWCYVEAEKIIASYSLNKEKGLGLMFVVETLNKTLKRGVIWVAYIDLATNEVILTKPYSKEPGGFGIRNYWASPIHSVITKVKQFDFAKWRKQELGKKK